MFFDRDMRICYTTYTMEQTQTARYLAILTDSLIKKNSILDRISGICTEHEKCLFGDKTDIDGYNRLMEEKGRLVNDLELIDDGFTALYERVSPVLREDPAPYADSIRRMQELINEISGRTALIQAAEIRIRSRLERLAESARPSRNTYTSAREAVREYSRTMQKSHVTQAIFVDNMKKHGGQK